jgi:hypothetical protein
MEERMDYFRAVETAIYEESGFQVTQRAALHARQLPVIRRSIQLFAAQT